MPRKTKRYAISVVRILQISNDISEDMCTATTSELIEVARYWSAQYQKLFDKKSADNSRLAVKLIDMATKALKR